MSSLNKRKLKMEYIINIKGHWVWEGLFPKYIRQHKRIIKLKRSRVKKYDY